MRYGAMWVVSREVMKVTIGNRLHHADAVDRAVLIRQRTAGRHSLKGGTEILFPDCNRDARFY